MKKYEFARTEIKYLGHLITNEGIKTDPEKVDAILRTAVPVDKTRLRRFIATVNFYKKFIENFNETAAPLYKLTSKKCPFVWDKAAQNAFDQLKTKLVNAPVLAGPNFENPFEIFSDASDKSIGAVLMQNNKPIAFASCSLNCAELKYTTSEKEALAIVWSVKYFKHYVYGRRVIVHTDHKPLADLKANRQPDEQLGRLMLKLQALDIEIKYVRGLENSVADFLSRDIINKAIEIVPVDWKSLQEEDGELKSVSKAIKTRNKSLITSSIFRRRFNKLSLIDEVIFDSGRIVIPASQRKKEIEDHHEIFASVTRARTS